MTYVSRGVSTRALEGVSLTVPPGQFLCVMGPSGSGKSTLLHLLAGLERPTAGEVRIGGTRVDQFSQDESARWRRRNIGMIHQFFNLIPTLNISQNIALPLLFEGRKMRELKPEILQLLERLKIANRRDHALDELSGGELQRVAIARALLPKPSVLLADEPTGNLDSLNGHEVLALFKEVCLERQVTTILMTHDRETIKYSDRVLMLRDGRIEQDEGGGAPSA